MKAVGTKALLCLCILITFAYVILLSANGISKRSCRFDEKRHKRMVPQSLNTSSEEILPLDDEWNVYRRKINNDLPEIIYSWYNSIVWNNRSLNYGATTIRIAFIHGPVQHGILNFKFEKLKPAEKLLEAELHIQHHKFTKNSSSTNKSFMFRLYQILSIDLKTVGNTNISINPDMQKLTNVVFLPTDKYDWQVMKSL